MFFNCVFIFFQWTTTEIFDRPGGMQDLKFMKKKQGGVTRRSIWPWEWIIKAFEYIYMIMRLTGSEFTIECDGLLDISSEENNEFLHGSHLCNQNCWYTSLVS